MIDGESKVVVERRIERRAGGGPFVAVLIVLGVSAAIALGWWSVGTPDPELRVSQTPPSIASPDTFVRPRTTVPEGSTATL